MKALNKLFEFQLFLLFFIFLLKTESQAQLKVLRGIEYHQISQFSANFYVNDIKMCMDGTTIVFSAADQGITKVFTMNANGTGLHEIYNSEMAGVNITVDISAGGDTVTWSQATNKIFSSLSNGDQKREIVTLIPHPNPIFADIEPRVAMPPRITADGSKIYFINARWEAEGAGVWKVNWDGTGLEQIFSFVEMSQELFGTDGIEDYGIIGFNPAFASGFDISASGLKILVGTQIYKLKAGDANRGDAVLYDNGTFKNMGEYAISSCSFATDWYANQIIMLKRETNTTSGLDEFNLYNIPVVSGSPEKLLGGMSTSALMKTISMDFSGSNAIVHGGIGSPYEPPITFINLINNSHFDLVNVDAASLNYGAFSMSGSSQPTLNDSGNLFCFLAPGPIIPQIWMGVLMPNGATAQPSITEITIDPNYIQHNRSTSSKFQAHVTSTNNPVQIVHFSTLKEGFYISRVITGDAPFNNLLMDDGTHGDGNADDYYYTESKVFRDLEQTQCGMYTIRFSSTDGKSITAVDIDTFFITGNTSDIDNHLSELLAGNILLSYPNPFTSETNIEYFLQEATFTTLSIYDISGREINVLTSGFLPSGKYEVTWRPTGIKTGVYFYRLQTNKFDVTRKLVLFVK